MEEAKKFYIKFKMNTERHIMENMIVSENRSTIDEWKGIHSEGHESEHDEEEEEEKPPGYPFQKAERDFELSINTFQTAVPFMMSALPVLRRVVDDMNIRKFVEKQATRLEAGEFELYQISLDHRSAILRKLQQSTAILTGINAIPDVFLMGLISAYDSFLADLIRCIFVERPELLSSSERNISFKDLMEIGSVEAARERIIEKEVETAIRDSHVQQIEWLEKKLSMPLRKDLKIWPQFVEICERRNLISHTDGVVSSQYLAVCKEHGVSTNGAAVGSRLEITAEYYRKSGFGHTRIRNQTRAGDMEEACA